MVYDLLHFFRSPEAWLPAQGRSPEDQHHGTPCSVLSRGECLSGVDDGSSMQLGRSSDLDTSESHVTECVRKPDEDHRYLIWTNYCDKKKFLESLI